MDRKNVIAALLLVLLALVVVLVTKDCGKVRERIITDTMVVERIDTMFVERTDTVPVLKYVTKIKEVMVPVEVKGDSVVMDVTQKVYTDDSTYTAFVSGIDYEDMPKMDSIRIRQREITRTIERTIMVEERKRWSFGIQVGAGLGVTTLKPDIYIGVGGTYCF